MNPDYPLENSAGLPLCKRGIEGDFSGGGYSGAVKIPPRPTFAKGGMPGLFANELSGMKMNFPFFPSRKFPHCNPTRGSK
jgi:hypothetical protein